MKTGLILSGLMLLSVPLFAVVISIEPDDFNSGADISTVSPWVALSSGGGAAGLNGKVYAVDSPKTSTGGKVFANSRTSATLWLNQETSGGYYLHADFTIPTNFVSIDIISDNGSDYPSISVYDTTGHLIESSYSFTPLEAGQIYTAVIQHTTADIGSIKAGGLAVLVSAVLLDNLRFEIPEPATWLILMSGLMLLKYPKR